MLLFHSSNTCLFPIRGTLKIITSKKLLDENKAPEKWVLVYSINKDITRLFSMALYFFDPVPLLTKISSFQLPVFIF